MEQLQAKIRRLEELLASAREVSDMRAVELRKINSEKRIDEVRQRLSVLPGVINVTVEPVISVRVLVESRRNRDSVYTEEIRLMDEFPDLQLDTSCSIVEDEDVSFD